MPPSYTVRIPANLKQPCADPAVFNGKDLGELVRYSAYMLETYHICAARQQALAKAAEPGKLSSFK